MLAVTDAQRRALLLVPVLALCHCGGSATASGGEGGASSDATTSGDGGDDAIGGGDARVDAGTGDAAPEGAAADSGAGGADAAADSPAGATDGGSCDQRFLAALDKHCSADTDCTTGNHSDCCGTVVVGIHVGTQAAFNSAEAAFQACVPGCGARGCFHATWSESGPPSPDSGAIVVHCDAGACVTRF